MMIEVDDPMPIPGEPFGSWLMVQAGRSDWIGDLAKAAKADRSFPRDGNPAAVRTHLREKQAESGKGSGVD